MLTLYQFPISHFCEKVRWALDYKKLNYRVKNLLPGLHMSKAKKLTGSSALPILVENGKVIQNSSSIISYLDAQFPQNTLTPSDEEQKRAVLAWEKFLDEEVGISVRLIIYHVMLEHPSVVIPFYTHQGPWYGNWVMKAAFPRVSKAMREMMNINSATALTAQQKLAQAIDKIHQQLTNTPFLVGDRFTRADLTAAALLAPLCKRQEYGLNWPQHFPEPLETIVNGYAGKIQWVHTLYDQYR
jgi:glutathione S-transferase